MSTFATTSRFNSLGNSRLVAGGGLLGFAMSNSLSAIESLSAVLSRTACASLPEVMRLVKFAVSRHCRRIRCSPEERADLLQEGIIAGMQAASSHDSSKGASNATWILRRIVGQIRDASQQIRNHGVTHRPPGVFAIADSTRLYGSAVSENGDEDDDSDFVSELIDDSLLPPDEQYMADEAMQRLGAELPEAHCALLRMYFAEGLSVRQIAARLDYSHATVAVRLNKALERAKRVLLRPKDLTVRH